MEAFPLYHVLLDKAKIFEMKQRIRVHAKKSYSNLILVLKELTHPGKAPVSQDLSEQFERYLALREPEFLRGLLARLDMPDSPAPDAN